MACALLLALPLLLLPASSTGAGAGADVVPVIELETPNSKVDGCTIEGVFIPVGEVLNTGPDPCNTYTCQAKDSVTALTCAYFSAGPGCEIVPGNMSAVYPYCCPEEDCNDNLINVDTF